MIRAAGEGRCARPPACLPPGRREVCEEPARRGSGLAAAGDARVLAPEDLVTCGPACATNLRAPPRAKDTPGRRAAAPRPRRRLPLPPPESRAASVGGAAGLQAGLSARSLGGRAAPQAPSSHQQPREAAAGPAALCLAAPARPWARRARASPERGAGERRGHVDVGRRLAPQHLAW